MLRALKVSDWFLLLHGDGQVCVALSHVCGDVTNFEQQVGLSQIHYFTNLHINHQQTQTVAMKNHQVTAKYF